MTERDDIKTMKLYTNIEGIKNELAVCGTLQSEYFDPIALSKIDSMHYMGISAIEASIAAMKLKPSSTVLDIGSRFGRTARILSESLKCATTALELQCDIHEMVEYLTKKCRLANLVKHVSGNILTFDLDKLGGGIASFDSMVSLLVFLYISDKASRLEKCAKMLKPGGTLFVEDFYCRSPFSEDEAKSLAEDVYAVNLPTQNDYISQPKASSFHNIQFFDKSSEWMSYVQERLVKFVSNRSQFEDIHGELTYLSLLHFYEAVAKLFSEQNLGGVRIIAEAR